MTKTTVRIRKWARFAPFILQSIGLLLAACLLLAGPASSPAQAQIDITGTPPPSTLAAPEFTPLPPEYFQTEKQSAGIALGAMVLVLIILISTLSVLLRRPRR